MKYEAAKCPSCGAQLKLDSGLETGFCVYCGSQIVVREAIQSMRIDVSGQVKIEGISTSESDIILGQHCISVNDWVKAANSFRSAIEKNANDFNAWYGCLETLTERFSTYKQVGGLFGFESAFKNCLKHGDSIQRDKVLSNTKSLLTSLQQREDDIYQKNVVEEKKYLIYKKRKQITISVFFTLMLTWLIMLFSENEAINSFAILPALMGLVAIALTIVNENSDTVSNSVKNGELHDEKLLESIKIIKLVLSAGSTSYEM